MISISCVIGHTSLALKLFDPFLSIHSRPADEWIIYFHPLIFKEANDLLQPFFEETNPLLQTDYLTE